MTESTPGLSDHVVAPSDASVFDTWDPANISPLVATLAMEECDITGQVFFVQGGTVRKFQNWTMTTTLGRTTARRWPNWPSNCPRCCSERGAPRGARRSRGRGRSPQRAYGPGAEAFGTLGTEAGSDLNWFSMLRHRAQARAEGSSRYQWWVLWSLLAGLFALNFTFTVFIVALPTVAAQFHTSVTVLTWTMGGPLLAYGLAAPILGKTGDIYGHRRLYLFGFLIRSDHAGFFPGSYRFHRILFSERSHRRVIQTFLPDSWPSRKHHLSISCPNG